MLLYQCIASLDSRVNYRSDADNLAQIKEFLVPLIASGGISAFHFEMLPEAAPKTTCTESASLLVN